MADLRRRRAAKRAENRDLANQEKALKKRRSRLMQVDLHIGARPIAANISVAVAEAARQLSTDDLVVLLQQQGTASVAWNRVRKSKMLAGAGRADGGNDGHAVPAGPVGEPGCDDCFAR